MKTIKTIIYSFFWAFVLNIFVWVIRFNNLNGDDFNAEGPIEPSHFWIFFWIIFAIVFTISLCIQYLKKTTKES